MSSKAPIPDPLIHPALLDPRQWGDVELYSSLLKVEREEISGDPHHAPDRNFRIHHLKLELRFDLPQQSVRGTATLTISPFADGLHSIELDAAEFSISSVRRLPPHAEPDDSPLTKPIQTSPIKSGRKAKPKTRIGGFPVPTRRIRK